MKIKLIIKEVLLRVCGKRLFKRARMIFTNLLTLHCKNLEDELKRMRTGKMQIQVGISWLFRNHKDIYDEFCKRVEWPQIRDTRKTRKSGARKFWGGTQKGVYNPTTLRNKKCSCKSGKKYKKCCGGTKHE